MTLDESVYKAVEVVFEAVKRLGKPFNAVLTDIAGKEWDLGGLDYEEIVRLLNFYPFWDVPPEGDAEAALKELFRDNDFKLEVEWGIEQGYGRFRVEIETRTPNF